MTRPICLAALAVTISSPAFADLTAADVWADFRTFAERNGQTLSAGSEIMDGSTLTVADVTISMDMPDGTLTGTMGDLSFVERGDGTVEVVVPSDYTMQLNMAFPDETEAPSQGSFAIRVSHTDLEMIASGSPEQSVYTFSAPEIGMAFDEMIVDGEVVPIDFDLSMTAFSGEYEFTDGDLPLIRSTFEAGAVSLAAIVSATEDAPEPGEVRFNVAMSSLAGTSSGTMGNFTAMAGLGELIDQGLVSDGNFAFADASLDVTGAAGTETFDLTATSGPGSLGLALGPAGLDYSGRASGVSVRMSGSEIPLPEVAFDIGSYGWGLAVPISVTEDPQDFALSLGLEDLTVSDMIWSMIDPVGALPRDPATLVVDLSGKANWLIDVTDPALANEPVDQMPGEIHALTLNGLRLALAGAELTGTGDFTFDNSAGPLAPPIPVGAIDLSLVGGNGLLDKLTTMGLLPMEQAMGARMMLGLFARPGDGPDTLESKIEFTATGGIIANGQPIR